MNIRTMTVDNNCLTYLEKPHAATLEIHKGKTRRKTHTMIWIADLYFLDALQVTETSYHGER